MARATEREDSRGSHRSFRGSPLRPSPPKRTTLLPTAQAEKLHRGATSPPTWKCLQLSASSVVICLAIVNQPSRQPALSSALAARCPQRLAVAICQSPLFLHRLKKLRQPGFVGVFNGQRLARPLAACNPHASSTKYHAGIHRQMQRARKRTPRHQGRALSMPATAAGKLQGLGSPYIRLALPAISLFASIAMRSRVLYIYYRCSSFRINTLSTLMYIINKQYLVTK